MIRSIENDPRLDISHPESEFSFACPACSWEESQHEGKEGSRNLIHHEFARQSCDGKTGTKVRHDGTQPNLLHKV
jgi:hypothetical protein